MSQLQGEKILLGVGGGIAAYKACELLRRLQDRGADVQVILTKAATQFVTPLTFQALSRSPVHSELFDLNEESRMSHIQLADEAKWLVIAPTTADLLAKLAQGHADDLLTTAALVTRARIVLAPSMNVNMWQHPAVRRNLEILRERGCSVVEPESGTLACGWEGQGRLAEVEGIVEHLIRLKTGTRDFSGKRFLITAGPTREYLDPVRFISNPSSGKMGFALAQAAQRRGAEVVLVTGPVALATPAGVQRVDVVSAEEMFERCAEFFPETDVLIATAAVGDFRPEKTFSQKIKKGQASLDFKLTENRDVLLSLSKQKRDGQILIGFAAETQDLEANARKKLQTKKLDFVVANDIGTPGAGFDSDQNQVTLIDGGGAEELPLNSKSHIAERILDKILTLK